MSKNKKIRHRAPSGHEVRVHEARTSEGGFPPPGGSGSPWVL